MTINFEGMTWPVPPDYDAKCPHACTAERCVISTVGVCKHPSMTSEEGCGPITRINRSAARKFLGIAPELKHEDVVR
jgi:hypothetical protein